MGLSLQTCVEKTLHEVEKVPGAVVIKIGCADSILGHEKDPSQLISFENAQLYYSQHYNINIKCKVEQSREWSSTLPYTSL